MIKGRVGGLEKESLRVIVNESLDGFLIDLLVENNMVLKYLKKN